MRFNRFAGLVVALATLSIGALVLHGCESREMARDVNGDQYGAAGDETYARSDFPQGQRSSPENSPAVGGTQWDHFAGNPDFKPRGTGDWNPATGEWNEVPAKPVAPLTSPPPASGITNYPEDWADGSSRSHDGPVGAPPMRRRPPAADGDDVGYGGGGGGGMGGSSTGGVSEREMQRARAASQSKSGGAVMGRRRIVTDAEADAPKIPLINGPFDEVWVIARVDQGQQAPQASDVELPGTGSLISRDLRRAFPLERTTVRADVTGPIASVNVSQRFSNPYAERIEAVYVFPLPHDAAVHDFVLEIGSRRIRGVIREREEARAVYEDARAQGLVASLLEQQRANIFRESVANIEPGKTVDVSLTFVNTSEYREGAWEWRFPMVVGPRYNPVGASSPVVAVPVNGGSAQSTHVTTTQYLAPGERSGADIDLQVELDAGARLTKLESPTHAIQVADRRGSRARVRLSSNDRIPNKDFVLRYATAGSEPSHAYVMHPGTAACDGALALTVMPPVQVSDGPRAPLEIIFVVDTSGSMDGRPIEQARNAICAALRQLTPADTFNIITFNDSTSNWARGMHSATPGNVANAISFVQKLQAAGGTVLEKGMRAALAVPHRTGAVRCLLFATDGFISNEDEILKAFHDSGSRDRVFALGVGTSVNWLLLNNMARVGHGAVASLGLNDDAAAVTTRFVDRIKAPVMHTLSVTFEGAQVYDMVPSRLDDVVGDKPVTLMARFNGPAPTRAVVTGFVGGQPVRIPLDLTASDQQHAAIPVIWARQRIAELSIQALWEDAHECRHAILRTALENNLMSPFTSFVVVDASRVTAGNGGVTVQQPVPMPEGVRYDTTVPSGTGSVRADRSAP